MGRGKKPGTSGQGAAAPGGSQKTVDDLVAEKKLEQVVADPETARSEIESAKTHLATAPKILKDDPALAYTAVYDAVRKTIQAHMRAKGLRAKKGPGHHIKTLEYAEAVLNAPTSHHTVADLDEVLERMRSTRNQLEYEGGGVGEDQVRADLEEARLIVEALEEDFLAEQADKAAAEASEAVPSDSEGTEEAAGSP